MLMLEAEHSPAESGDNAAENPLEFADRAVPELVNRVVDAHGKDQDLVPARAGRP